MNILLLSIHILKISINTLFPNFFLYQEETFCKIMFTKKSPGFPICFKSRLSYSDKSVSSGGFHLNLLMKQTPPYAKKTGCSMFLSINHYTVDILVYRSILLS
jgi:hypothetical protein